MKNFKPTAARKIKTKQEIEKVVQELRNADKNICIVTTNGAFDLIHSGHITSLEHAKSLGDILIVGLNSDSSVKRYKSNLRPIIPQKERAKMLASLEAVDYVVIFEEDNPNALLEIIKPNKHVKSKSGFKGLERETVENHGGEITLLDDVIGISTTQILNKVLDIYQKEGKI